SGLVPGTGSITHSWLPRSMLRFRFTEAGNSNSIGYSGGALAIPGFAEPAATHMFRGGRAGHLTFDGIIDPIASSYDASNIAHVIFHFANLPTFQNAIRH